MPSHDEDDQQAMLFQWAAHIPELKWLHAIPNGGKRNVREAARLKKQGVKSGVSDVFLPLARDGYHGLYVEMKNSKGTGKLSLRQSEFLRDMRDKNYCACFANGFSEAKELIESYLSS